MALRDVSLQPVGSGAWRQPYLAMLEASWPRFLLLVTALYVVIHLLFAALYLLDPAGIGGVSEQMALPLQAFFFSVETMATIGYGAVYPLSHWVHLVMTLEALGGLLFLALITGLAFARFERAPQDLAFAANPALVAVDQQPCLLIDLHNPRRSILHAVQVRAFWCEPAGSGLIRHQLLPLLQPDGLPLEGDLRLALPLQSDGPLAPLGTPGGVLPPGSGELLLTFTACDGLLERPVHLCHRYRPDQLPGVA